MSLWSLGIAALIFVLLDVVAVCLFWLYSRRHPGKGKKLHERFMRFTDKLFKAKDRDIWVP